MTAPTLVTRDNRFVEWEIALTADTSAYVAGDLVCAKISFENAIENAKQNGLVIRQVAVHDLAKQDHDFDLILFDADPDGTTFTLNAAADIADADLPKVAGNVDIDTYLLLNDNGVALATPNLYLVLPGAHFYGMLVTRGTPTYGAADLTIRVLAERV